MTNRTPALAPPKNAHTPLAAGRVARPSNSAGSYATVREAATALRVQPSTIRRLIGAGRLPAARLGRLVRIDALTLHRLVGREARDAR